MDKKEREHKEHLHILLQILQKAGFKVGNHLDNDKEPYIFVRKPVEKLSFDGVRIYIRGKDIVCYRPQNKEHTEPFGTSNQLDLEGMFKDLIRDTDKKMIGNRIIFYVVQELKEFFVNSAKAERDEDPPMGDLVIGSTSGTDYANTVTARI